MFLFEKVSTCCRLAYCQTSLRPGSFMNIGITNIHFPSTTLEWTSERLSCSIQLSRMLLMNDEKAAPEDRSSWPIAAESLRLRQRSRSELRTLELQVIFP